MTIYPDTTFYVALRFFDDTHHEAAKGSLPGHLHSHVSLEPPERPSRSPQLLKRVHRLCS